MKSVAKFIGRISNKMNLQQKSLISAQGNPVKQIKNACSLQSHLEKLIENVKVHKTRGKNPFGNWHLENGSTSHLENPMEDLIGAQVHSNEQLESIKKEIEKFEKEQSLTNKLIKKLINRQDSHFRQMMSLIRSKFSIFAKTIEDLIRGLSRILVLDQLLHYTNLAFKHIRRERFKDNLRITDKQA